MNAKAIFAVLDKLNPTLREAELRTLHLLVGIAVATDTIEIRESQRMLATRSGMRLATLNAAVQSLDKKRVLNLFPGRRGSSYHLACLSAVYRDSRDKGRVQSELAFNAPDSRDTRPTVDTKPKDVAKPTVQKPIVPLGVTLPPPVQKEQRSQNYNVREGPLWEQMTARQRLSELRGLPVTQGVTLPPLVESEKPDSAHIENARVRVDRVVNSSSKDLSIDLSQIFQSEIAFEETALADCRTSLRAYMETWGAGPATKRDPDRTIASQILVLAKSQEVVHSLLTQLASEGRRAGEQYAWFVTVFAQRLYNIDPQQLRRARLDSRKQVGRETAGDYLAQIKSGLKRMG